MRWLLALLGVLLGVVALTFGIQIGNLRSQLDTQQQQLRSVQAQLTAVSAKASGGHRDLITCADVQGMGLEMLLDVRLNTDAGGFISAVPDQQPVSLPSHCINQ